MVNDPPTILDVRAQPIGDLIRALTRQLKLRPHLEIELHREISRQNALAG